jgi:signal peptidase I
MASTFKDGEAVNVLKGYFECNAPKRDQIVMIEFGTRDEFFVKRLVANAGDMLEFKEGHAERNGEVLRNPDGEAYQFSASSERLLSNSLYEGKIQEGYYLVLADDPDSNSFDSRQYGFLDKDHLAGLVLKQ